MNKPGLSIRAYARHRGCDESSVREAIASGRLRKSLTEDGKRILDAAEADTEWALTTKSEMRPLTGPAGCSDLAPDYGESRARREAAEAELAEIELAEKKGALIPSGDVETRLVDLFGNCRTKLLGVPSQARQQDPGLTNAQVDLFEQLIRDALTDLAREGDDE